MILKMEKLSAFGLLRDKGKIADALMKKQCVQIKSPESHTEFEELKKLTESCTAEVYATEQKLSRYTTAMSAMSFYAKKSGLFAQKPRVAYDGLGDEQLLSKAEELCASIERAAGEISELRAAKNKNQFLVSSLEPWQDADLPVELSATRETTVTRYLFPAKIDRKALLSEQQQTAPLASVAIVGEDREQLYAMVICHKSQDDALWELLKEQGAAKASFTGVTGTPRENIAAAQKSMENADKRLAELEDELRTIGEELYPLKYAIDSLSVNIQREKASNEMRATRESFLFMAWVPETAKAEVVSILDQYGCYYEFTEPDEGEEAPILLRNAKAVAPYETITQMYSAPSYWGFDPNFFVSIFYFIIFGMMLSDAGVGLLVFLGCWFISRKTDLGAGAKKLVTVLKWGGFSTMIWGAIFGSFFGDFIQVVARTWFNVELAYGTGYKPLLDPLGQAVEVMALSMIIGLVHIFLGMGIKAYMLVKRGRPWEALFDVGFWFFFIVGLVVMLAAVIFTGTESTLYTVGVVIAIIGAAGLILTQGRDKKNPFMKLMSGIMSLYDITGYMSDVLSYSRILALGLATGVIAQVFNTMGTLAGGGILGVVIFIPIFLAGTLLNTGINTLGSYVHAARLQYVEFFSKFYEAGGKPFAPFAAQTKYLIVTNEEEN